MDLRSVKPLTGRRNPTSAGRRGLAARLQARRYSVGGPGFGRLETGDHGSVAPFSSHLRPPACVRRASLAQDANYASVDAIPDKPVQLSYHASAHKSNCSPGALPTVRVIEAPKSGILTVRDAMLTTDKIAGCPALKIPARVVLYTANTDYTGPDHVKYEVKDENGRGRHLRHDHHREGCPTRTKPAGQSADGTTGGQPL